MQIFLKLRFYKVIFSYDQTKYYFKRRKFKNIDIKRGKDESLFQAVVAQDIVTVDTTTLRQIK